jgi:CDP-paratose synthetase
MASNEVALVTGGTGFIGKRLVRALLKRDISVRIISSNKAKQSEYFGESDQIIWYGISDNELARAASGVTLFFNFAVAYDHPTVDDEAITEVNFVLPLKIISLLKRQEVAATCVLGDTFFRKFPPEATRQPRYTRSKINLAERISEEGHDSLVRLALLQIEQVYGPGDAFTKSLPSIVRSMILNRPMIPMTTGSQERDFIYVDDVVDAALLVANAEWKRFAIIECGSGNAVPVRQVFERLHKISNSRSVLGFGELKNEQSIPASSANTDWLKQRNWKPMTNLTEGLLLLVRDIQSRVPLG